MIATGVVVNNRNKHTHSTPDVYFRLFSVNRTKHGLNLFH